MNKHLLLMLGVSGLALVSAEAMAQNQLCNGTQSRPVTCLDWQGNVVSSTFCSDGRVGARPNSVQGCVFSCGDGDGDGDGGGDPLVFDLDGNGVNLTSALDGVSFDLDNDGILDQTGWTDGIDGLLAIDHDGNGTIDNQSELFGESRDYAAFADLASYDSNGDGEITADDDVWGDLTMWVDGNRDGISDAHEMLSMEDIGMTSISLDSITDAPGDIAGNEVTKKSTFTRIIEGIGEVISDVLEVLSLIHI